MKPLTKEEKNQMMIAIQRFFAEEREEEIGELAAINILEFITKNLGSYYYNQGFVIAGTSLFRDRNC